MRGLLLVLCLAGCRMAPAPGSSPAAQAPEVTLFGVQMLGYRQGELAQVVRAAEVRYQRHLGQMEAVGEVELRSRGGVVGQTARAQLDLRGQTASGQEPVRVAGPGFSLSAQRFSLDSSAERVTFAGQVRSASQPDAGSGVLSRPVVVSADQLEVFSRDSRAVYSGHARAVRDHTTISCERITLSYSQGQEVRQVLAEGQVEVVDGELWARGDRADFDNQSGLLVMTGSPQARLGQAQVAGKRISFTTGTERVEVEEARTAFEDPAPGGAAPRRVQVDAPRLELNRRSQQAVWSGKVRARRGETRIHAARMVAHYGEDREIRRLEATGGVEVFDGERFAKGERADFDNRTGVLVMTGRPEARQGANQMRGSRVTFTLGTDTLEVTDAVTVIHSEMGAPRLPGGKQ